MIRRLGHHPQVRSWQRICLGFNKYYPPDYDPEKHKSLNAYRGKHALGDRARKIDQGVLITRFELPFNIWCATCDNHIGMGVRYNAEKKKIGSYYSTPIYSFRCKCHLCSGWFEIQTDPKNTRYVVVSGARQKEEGWDPEENGGFAVHDTESKQGTEDPLAALEKTTAAQDHMNQVQIPRLEALQNLSDHYGSDPYTLSKKARKRFREVKRVEKEKQAEENELKGRYGLPEELKLTRNSKETEEQDREEWRKARRELEERENAKRQRLETPSRHSIRPLLSSLRTASGSRSLSSQPSAAELLRARIQVNSGHRKLPGSK
ncbi:uncharacterized protein PHACADRAFT_206701 [Phanerochaete carnosa HHB-10118-sp]|uniref:DUF572-domain-containing protein n=1 Tax=Phanerochaete carnosa (strain HHB-10118-sp) TaxID=650164 RepID=K5WFK0_PHACS|nr:uncharacterized protein PHACADRAFT_206701 [Phanerochaete carnosa HHB-10118-sp]EKM57829.1 hypothetical protein PHACADRAFT_206701 [Phanerochaete carnosa HHB-10118-sp]